MSGGQKQAKPAGGRPLDGGVRRRVEAHGALLPIYFLHALKILGPGQR